MPDAVLRLGFTVLDRQIVDREGNNTGKVDDVEFTWDGKRAPVMTALLTDTAALGPRLSGRLGRFWRTVMQRMRPTSDEPVRVPVEDVEEFSPSTRLRTAAPENAVIVEDWLREHVIGRIPGSGS
ncbi:hypothetical protein [Nocardiopsis algeriensis]|uniref:hypothetical protein n=1 Tax=Nocardiopsis algeriensis TaxID=1478215 RepID=UPI003B42CDA7